VLNSLPSGAEGPLFLLCREADLMRSLKKCHATMAYATAQMGLASITCVPTAHQNHPKYDGCRRYLRSTRK